MAKDPQSKDLFDFELPEGLDNDVGGDWESAFQAEDFMLSPEDEAEVFLEKAGGSPQDEKLDDLASLLISEEPKAKEASVSTATALREKTIAGPEKKGRLPLTFLPAALSALLARSAVWLKTRPVYQKILFPSLALVIILFFGAFLFFHSTSQQLAKQQPSTIESSAESQRPPPPSALQENKTEPGLAVPQEPASLQAEQPPAPDKSRKKWRMPAFFIAVPQENGQENLLVKIDLTLVLLLEPGGAVPDEKGYMVRDTIFQFFVNRPPDELRRYALARGEMISNLRSWLQKEWPQNPISTIIFDRYQILN